MKESEMVFRRMSYRVLRFAFVALVGPSAGGTVATPMAQTTEAAPSPAGALNLPACQWGDVNAARANARVSTRAQLEAAIRAGSRLIWIENSAAIDLSVVDHRANPADEVLTIPPNVTLASGRSPTQQGGPLVLLAPHRGPAIHAVAQPLLARDRPAAARAVAQHRTRGQLQRGDQNRGDRSRARG